MDSVDVAVSDSSPSTRRGSAGLSGDWAPASASLRPCPACHPAASSWFPGLSVGPPGLPEPLEGRAAAGRGRGGRVGACGVSGSLSARTYFTVLPCRPRQVWVLAHGCVCQVRCECWRAAHLRQSAETSQLIATPCCPGLLPFLRVWRAFSLAAKCHNSRTATGGEQATHSGLLLSPAHSTFALTTGCTLRNPA